MFGVLRLGKLGASMKRAGFNPRALFAASEPGAWYDPSDLSTMYQDADGTTPVYMPGQGQVDPPVGLWLDKRLPIGSELVLNGDNESSVAVTHEDVLMRLSKTRTADFAQSGAFSTKLTSTAGSWTHYWQLWKVPANKSVLVTGFVYVPAGAAAGQPIRIVDQSDGSVIVDVAPAASTDRWVSFRYYRAPKGTQWVMSLGNNIPADWGTTSIYVDNLSIRELPGNHATQPTTTCRPTLSARYNLLQQSEATYQAPWGFVNTSGSATQTLNTYTFGSSPLDRVRQTSSAIPANATIAASAVLSGSGNVRLVLIHGDGSGSTSLAVTLTDTPTSYVLTVSNPVAGAHGGVGIYNNAAGLPGAVMNVHRTDLRLTNDGVGLPPYQRVVDADTYDTVGFPLYLKFDGVDDSLQTANIDFTGFGEVLVAAAIRKLSDSARGFVCELGADTSLSFGMAAPNGVNSTVSFYSRGTVQRVVEATQPAPVSLIAVGQGVIRDDISKVRINGVPAASSSADQGTGDYYGNLPLFIGRRGGLFLPFNGRLYSLLVRGAITPDAQIATVERYLNSKARIY